MARQDLHGGEDVDGGFERGLPPSSQPPHIRDGGKAQVRGFSPLYIPRLLLAQSTALMLKAAASGSS